MCSSSETGATSMSSIYLKQKSSPRNTSSINHWNVCAAFWSPKDLYKNLKRLNGVMIAALGTSSSASGIWLYAQTESIVEKNFCCRESVQNIECDIGYHYTFAPTTNFMVPV